MPPRFQNWALYNDIKITNWAHSMSQDSLHHIICIPKILKYTLCSSNWKHTRWAAKCGNMGWTFRLLVTKLVSVSMHYICMYTYVSFSPNGYHTLSVIVALGRSFCAHKILNIAPTEGCFIIHMRTDRLCTCPFWAKLEFFCVLPEVVSLASANFMSTPS
jgi:hypothetical protein